MDEGDVKLIMLTVGAVIFIIVLVFVVSYRNNETITIQDRYWQWQIAVKYDEVYYTTETTCTGTGDDRKCSTDLERHTTTYTRCNDVTYGRELPPQKPDIPCQMFRGDYLWYALTYHEVDKRDRQFPAGMWNYLEPGLSRLVQTDILGNIVAEGKE